MADSDITAVERFPVSPEDIDKAGHNTNEMGVTGLAEDSGFIREEWLSRLSGKQGRKIYREMTDNSPSVGSVLLAMRLLLRNIEWRVEISEDAEDRPGAEEIREFVEGVLMADMSHTWPDFLTECLTMLPFGFSWFEIVIKRRVGPEENNAARRSKFTDGKIGIRKLAPRAQESLHRWVFDDDGGVSAFVQWDDALGEIVIPIERSLLFRTESIKNNPEGRSVLRNAYTSYYNLKAIERIEVIGIERELTGFPIVRVPQAVLTSADANAAAILAKFRTIARDIRLGEQDGVVIASDTYEDSDGRSNGAKLYDIELLNGGGQRSIDTVAVSQRYESKIMLSMLGQFMQLGQTQTGSFALSRDQRQMFHTALQAFVDQITAPINRFLIPRLLSFNGMDLKLAPRLTTSKVGGINLELIADFIAKTATSGMPWFPDDELQNAIRRALGLPDQPDDLIGSEDNMVPGIEPNPDPNPIAPKPTSKPEGPGVRRRGESNTDAAA